MFQNGRCETCEDVEAAPGFTDVPFPHHHKKRPFAHWCKQGKKRGKQNAGGRWTDGLQYEQLLPIWSNCSFQLVSLFRYFSIYLGWEDPTRGLSLNIMVIFCPSWLRLVSQAAQRSHACIALKLHSYQLTDFSCGSYNTHNCSEHKSPALIKERGFLHCPFFPSDSCPFHSLPFFP